MSCFCLGGVSRNSVSVVKPIRKELGLLRCSLDILCVFNDNVNFALAKESSQCLSGGGLGCG